MTRNISTEEPISRRTVLRRGVAAGALALLAADTASAHQGGVAYLKEKHLRGKNNPNETRFKIVDHCWTDQVDLPCDGDGEKTYAAYKIRCPNYPGGGGGHDGGHNDDHDHGEDSGHEEASAEQHDDGDHGGCPGGGCGRHVLVNPNRRLDTSTDQLYEFAVHHDCGGEYVKGAFRPVNG